MGRKEAGGHGGAANMAAPPVEDYRKRIGKQDWKKSKKEMKAIKKRSDTKKSAIGIKEVFLMVGAFALTLAGVYAFLYFYLMRPDQTSNSNK